jgi:hypothetical protein
MEIVVPPGFREAPHASDLSISIAHGEVYNGARHKRFRKLNLAAAYRVGKGCACFIANFPPSEDQRAQGSRHFTKVRSGLPFSTT